MLYRTIAIVNLFILASFFRPAWAESLPSYAFWYGNNPPVDLLSQFDRIIVEAGNINHMEVKKLQQHGGKIIAYLSLGERIKNETQANSKDQHMTLGDNSTWGTQVMDLSSPDWRQIILDKAKQLSERGFQGFFLDTLDSYMLADLPPAGIKAQQQGLSHLVQQLKEQYPGFVLIANRGFEIMEQIAPYLEAVAAESLYRGWDNSTQRYVPVPERDRTWLKTTLQKIRARYQLDIVILDYLPPSEREQALEVARKIEEDGFIPWIANPAFTYMGIGAIETIPRKVLLLYDGQGKTDILPETNVHRLGALPFEYMGYIPQFADVRQELPKGILKGRYSGIICWFTTSFDNGEFRGWLTEQIKEKIPLVFLGNIDLLTKDGLAKLLGLQVHTDMDVTTLSLIEQSKLIGFETSLPERIEHVSPLQVTNSQKNHSHLRMQDKSGLQVDLVAIAEWGGFASDPAVVDEDFDSTSSWIINPFEFFKQALQLPQIPAPDVTTENGRRLLFVHIDGFGFTEKFERPDEGYSADILLKNIFKRYRIPQTISAIEGEIGPSGLHPETSGHFESIAQKIFALDHVEIASNSYSHPFEWNGDAKRLDSPIYDMPINGYHFSLEREITGSIQYINTRLAPKNKKKTTVFLWTGNCLPPQEAVAMATEDGVLNINGGNGRLYSTSSLMTNLTGMGRSFANSELQTYAAFSDENAYTNNWTGPFYGYRDVVDTFKRTNSPRRLKPINIHYHFYSGSKIASVKALQTVYEWAMSQETTPIFASDYIRKVQNYQTIGVARRSDGSWRVSGMSALRTLRSSLEDGWPDPSTSTGIAGWRESEDEIYLHADPSSVMEFKLKKRKPESIHLRQTNGRLIKWNRNANSINFQIQGYVPVTVELENVHGSCKVLRKGGVLSPQKAGKGRVTFTFPGKDTGNARIQCND